MQTFVKEIPLAFLEASLEDEQGYTEFVEEARLVLKWEVTHVSAQGDEGLVYKDATLSRLVKTVSSMEPEEPDGWKLIDGQWRWESDESRSSCRRIVNVPSPEPTPTPVPDESGYTWTNPADLGDHDYSGGGGGVRAVYLAHHTLAGGTRRRGVAAHQ